jgi:hypothetical protein
VCLTSKAFGLHKHQCLIGGKLARDSEASLVVKAPGLISLAFDGSVAGSDRFGHLP